MSGNEIGFEDQLKKSKYSDLFEIPVSANAWITRPSCGCSEVIVDKGLANWVSDQTVVSIYFKVEKSIKADLYIKCKVPNGKSKIQVTIGQTSQVIGIGGDDYKWYRIGTFKISDPGYVKLDFKGIKKSGLYFADVSHFGLQSNEKCITCIRDIDPDHTYWSRRGPSVHLKYLIPNKQNKYEYYYNEMTIPSGYDPIGSYYMAIGFGVGYFGLQVNSESERRVLFSVWSPQKTDDKNCLREENKIKLVSKSPDVVEEVFEAEGCGGKSFLKYMWSPDITYKFLVRGRPDPTEPNNTTYSGWFAELDRDWKLIASFKRPKTNQYLSSFHSFLENFEPNYGCMTRKARYGNQWMCTTDGTWSEVTSAQLTGDSTAQKKVRLDFDGGLESIGDKTEVFYLQNCGFFDKCGQLNKKFTRNENKSEPKVSFT